MKKIITLSAVAFLSTALYANADMQEQIDQLTKKVQKLEKKTSKINAQSAKDNIKFDVDFRTSYDNLNYKTVNGNKYENNALFSNRLWLGMGYAPEGTDMVFKGQLSFNKAFGASYGQRATGMGFDTFDWVVNENLTDDKLRVREAYWLWTPTIGGVGTTFSIGRRPATNGYLINLRDDDKAKSPLGHVINMEFDGASVGISLDSILPGGNFKVCAGRGLTNAASWASQASGMINPMYPNTGATPNYIPVDGSLDNTDMLGFIFVPYDDGQYAVETTYYRGFSVPGMVAKTANAYYDGTTGQQMGMEPTSYAMESMGNMDGAAISFKVEGIGDEINDFLDETIIFASLAWSKSNPEDVTRNVTMMDVTGTNPDQNMNMTAQSMLGSDKSETGTSYWIGAQMPNLTGGKFGLEYNHGSEHWKSFTYGEDTMAGSKMAVRGSAYEAYWTQPINKAFSMQVRYTMLDYDYTGSSGFFGDGSTSAEMGSEMSKQMDSIEKAQDIRVYFRYRY
ncbi:MAG: DUF3373 family protein [Campylobacterota bacterium]|nr:DUF3373 family protein [Campylobacterota bacterium]